MAMSDVLVGIFGIFGIYAMIAWLVFWDAGGDLFRQIATAIVWPAFVAIDAAKVVRDHWRA